MEKPEHKKTLYKFKLSDVKGAQKALLNKSKKCTFCDILYDEYQLYAKNRDGGKSIEVSIYTLRDRDKLRSALKKYKMDSDKLRDLFYKKHLELKKENVNTGYMRNRRINEKKSDVIEPDSLSIENAGVQPQSVAKILGIAFYRAYVEPGIVDTFDAEEFYDYVVDNWDSIIDEYDKANEKISDEEGTENVAYELDEKLSDGSATLKDFGVEDVETFIELILSLGDVSEAYSMLKEQAEEDDEEWKDNTQLDDVDALEMFDKLVDMFYEDEADKGDDDKDDDNDSDVSDGDIFDEAIREGYEYVAIYDIIKEAEERGKREAMREMNEGKVDLQVGHGSDKKTITYDNSSHVRKSDIEDIIKLNYKAVVDSLRVLKSEGCCRGVKVPAKTAITVENMSALRDEMAKFEKDIKGTENYIIYSALKKALNVLIVCLRAKEKQASKKDESVASKFAKYRKMFEGEDKANDSDNADDKSDDSDADNKGDGTNDDVSDVTTDDDTEELEGLKVTIKKSEKGGDDFVDKFKEMLIEKGVEEDDIKEVDNDNEDEATFEVAGNSCDKLIEIASEYGFDIEKELEKSDDDKDDKDDDKGGDDKDNKDNTQTDGAMSDEEIDAMWNDIFGTTNNDDTTGKDGK